MRSITLVPVYYWAIIALAAAWVETAQAPEVISHRTGESCSMRNTKKRRRKPDETTLQRGFWRPLGRVSQLEINGL